MHLIQIISLIDQVHVVRSHFLFHCVKKMRSMKAALAQGFIESKIMMQTLMLIDRIKKNNDEHQTIAYKTLRLSTSNFKMLIK